MEDTDLHVFSGIFSPQPFDVQSSASLEVVPRFREGPTPRVPTAIVSPWSTPTATPIATPGRTRLRRRNAANRPKLRLLRLEEWDKDKVYDDDPPTCLHYTIEWSATLNEKEFVRETESDVVLNPAAYWQLSLQRRVEGLVQKRLGNDRNHQVDHAVVVVSLSGRSQPKVIKHFEAGIDWQCVEKQLTQWSEQFQSGKTLRVDITLHYVEAILPPVASSSRRGSHQQGMMRGASSATQRMRTRLANQRNAEEASDAERWTDVYRVMRCPDACSKGPHCFVDPVTKKHIKMFSHHLEDLINHKDVKNGKFESQDDIPDDFRRQILAEEQQRRGPVHGTANKSSTGVTPITINNHFPDHTLHGSASAPAPVPPGELTGVHTVTEPLELPSPLDKAVRDYSEWQKSRVSDTSWKADIDHARDVVLAQRRDLHQIHTDRNISFLLKENIPVGTAKRFADDITLWNKRRRCET